MDLNIVDLNNKKIDKYIFEIDENIQINRKVISQVVRWQLLKKRQGTASTKNRALVAGSNKKPFKQKGTGNARAGTRTSPIWRGGGVIFGPTPKDWSIKVPKKVRKIALLHSIFYKIKQDAFTIIDNFKLSNHKTKNLIAKIDGLKLSNKTLLITDEENDNLVLATRNLRSIKLVQSKGVNVYDLLNFNSILIDKTTLSNLIERIK